VGYSNVPEIPPASELEWVDVSNHAGERWHQYVRTSPGYGPIIAWNLAKELTGDHGLYCDEARYDETTDAVILVERDEDMGDDVPRVMVTVMRGRHAKTKTQNAIVRVIGHKPRLPATA